MQELEIKLLHGALRLYRSGIEIAAPTQPMHQALLLVLAVHATQSIPASTLARAYYGDPAATSDNIKRVVEDLSVLRSKFELPISQRTYTLDLPRKNVDVLLFERFATKILWDSSTRRTDPTLLTEIETALDLWVQDPTTTFQDIVRTDLFSRFTRLHRDLVTLLIQLLLEQGEAWRASSVLASQAAPYSKYGPIEELSRRVDEKLTTVARETQPQHPETIKHNLPPFPSQFFFGRDTDLTTALNTLRPYPYSQYPVLGIDGVGGVGKTALALALGHYLASGTTPPTVRRESLPILPPQERFDAITWISAKKATLEQSGIVARQPALRNLPDLYTEIAATLERPEIVAVPEEQQKALVRTTLASGRYLLIIDNLETVDDPRILSFIRDLPAPTKAVITTRHRIDGAISLRLGGLGPEDALALIDAETGRRGLQLSNDERKAMAAQTGGIPLAIIWSIAQAVSGGTIERILLRLRSAKGDYAKFCFDECLKMLEDSNQTVALNSLMSLSMFAAGATREAIGFVSGFHELPEERDRALRTLADLSLVNFTDERFFLLPLTQEYALAELKRNLEFETFAMQRWYEWHVNLTSRAASGGSDLDSSVLKQLEREHENVVWAIDQSWRSEAPLVLFVKLLRSMEFFWLETGRWREFEVYLEKGRFLAPEPVDRIHFTGRLAWMYVLRGDLVKAQEILNDARGLLRRFPNRYELMRVEDFEGQLAFEHNDWAAAEEHFRNSLALAADMNDRRGLFACHKYLGDVYCELGMTDQAWSELREAEVYVGDPGQGQWLRGNAFAAHLRGLILQHERDWSGAERAFQECIDYLSFHPDVRLLTRARYGLSLVKLELGARSAGLEVLKANLNAFRALGMWSRLKQTEDLLTQIEGGDGDR